MDPAPFHNVYAWGQEEQQLAAIQRKFLRYLPSSGSVLDLGCGRGVFLDLAKDAGYEAVGVDRDENMVRDSRERGHRVVVGDVLGFLRDSDEEFDGILASHIIEHMPVADQIELIDLMKRRLKPRGVAIVATPRPGSLWATEAFWLDTTHVRPMAYGLMEQLFAPFEILAGGIEPDSDPTKDLGPLIRIVMAIRRRLIGRELYDFAYGGGVNYIIARRP